MASSHLLAFEGMQCSSCSAYRQEDFRKQLTLHMGKTTSVTDCYHFFACTHSQICLSHKNKHCKKELKFLKRLQKQNIVVETC